MMEGVVVKIIDSKSVKVDVATVSFHPLYKKMVKTTKSFLCHNENIDINKGDKVCVCGSRPYSKKKKYIVVKKK